MAYSEKLNGYWEEGYHYYLEFCDDRLIVRDYRRDISLTTEIRYDAAKLEAGERTVISLEDNVLSRTASGDPFTMIRELAYENGELKLLYYYTIMGETLYTLKKVDHGPFSHILIRDGEFMEKIQGEWVKWGAGADAGIFDKLVIRGNHISAFATGERAFHIVSYTYDRDHVYLVPENLIDSDFGAYTRVEVLPDMLTARMVVFDASVPLSVFARRENLDKIDVPASAKEPMRSTMDPRLCVDTTDGPAWYFENKNKSLGIGFMGMNTDMGKTKWKCPSCGNVQEGGKFCTECGTRNPQKM